MISIPQKSSKFNHEPQISPYPMKYPLIGNVLLIEFYIMGVWTTSHLIFKESPG